MIEAVFFDLDDTLCDFQPAWELAVARGLTIVSHRTGVPYVNLLEAWRENWKELMQSLGSGAMNMAGARQRRAPMLLSRFSIEDDELAQELDLAIGQELLEQLRLFDDVDVLGELRGKVKVAIVTNGADDDHPDSQRSKALRLGLLEQVDAFFASDTHGARKPNPAFFLAAARALGVQPDRVIFVGDSPANDVSGANDAGMISVLLQRSATGQPHKENPRHIIHSLRELPSILG